MRDHEFVSCLNNAVEARRCIIAVVEGVIVQDDVACRLDLASHDRKLLAEFLITVASIDIEDVDAGVVQGLELVEGVADQHPKTPLTDRRSETLGVESFMALAAEPMPDRFSSYEEVPLDIEEIDGEQMLRLARRKDLPREVAEGDADLDEGATGRKQAEDVLALGSTRARFKR